MYWTTVGGAKRQTHAVVRRSIRRAPPSSLRPQPSATASPQTAIGCLWAVGALLAVGVVLVTQGLALIPIALAGWWWIDHRNHKPSYQARQLISKAVNSADPVESVHLLHQAVDLDPAGADTLLACANWFFAKACWADAADCYGGYLHVGTGRSYELAHARALIRAGHPDDAIVELEHLRAYSGSGDEAEIISELAFAFLLKHDPGQAEALVNTAPLQRHQLDSQLQNCLYMRAVSRYLNGHRARAVSDLERLYAQNPNFPDLAETKAKMTAGRFELAAPAPYPNWYPAQVEQRVGPEVEEVSGGHTEEIQPGTLSPDELWRWDGTQWIPAHPNAAAIVGVGETGRNSS